MGTWTNDDGLHIRYGSDEAAMKKVGSFADFDGGRQILEVEFDYNDVTSAGSETILSDGVRIPAGVFLEKAEFVVETAFTSGGAATLTFGLIDEDRSTAFDADGIDAAIAITAIDAAGDNITCDGAVVGTVLTNSAPMLVTATVGTAVFTAGKGRLRLWLQS